MLAKSEAPYYYLSNSVMNQKTKKNFQSVTSYDRGTLYERALKKMELQKLNAESLAEKQEHEIAALSFHPDVSKSMKTFAGTSPARKTFEQLYSHLVKSKLSKSRQKALEEEHDAQTINDLKKQLLEIKSARQKTYS
jgi:hypothetical protein